MKASINRACGKCGGSYGADGCATHGTERIRYRVRWREDGRSRSKGFDTEDEAAAFIQKRSENPVDRLGEAIAGIEPRTATHTVAEAYHDYLDVKTKAHTAKTQGGHEGNWRNYLEPRWGSVSVNSITTGDIESWLANLRGVTSGEPLSRSALSQLRSLMRQSLQRADRKGWLNGPNPAQGVELPDRFKGESKAVRICALMDADSVRRLADEMPQQYAAMVWIMGTAGLRWAEVVGLTFQQVDLEAGSITVDRTLSEVGGRFYEGPPKNKHSRVVNVGSATVAAIERHRRLAPGLPEARLFNNEAGQPVRNKFILRIMAPAVERAGLPTGITPHILRHGAASLLVNAGLDFGEVAAHLGHLNVSTTIQTYSHLVEGAQDRTRAALEEIWG